MNITLSSESRHLAPASASSAIPCLKLQRIPALFDSNYLGSRTWRVSSLPDLARYASG